MSSLLEKIKHILSKKQIMNYLLLLSLLLLLLLLLLLSSSLLLLPVSLVQRCFRINITIIKFLLF